MRASSMVEPRSRGRPASSEVGPRPRGRPTLERGGTSLEGATGPRARRNLTRGGDQPSSEAKGYLCGAVPLERSGVPPEGGWVDCLVGRWDHLGRRPVSLPYVCFGFVYVLFFVSCEGKWVFLGCLGDPFGCPRQCQCSLYGHQSSSSLTNEAY
jgi:hypothetical protein